MTTTFDALGVSSELTDALAAQGIDEPFAIQTLAIADALAGRDVLRQGQDRVGQDPGLRPPAARPHRPSPSRGHPHGLVLVPTRELANQVRGVLAPLGQA